MTVCRRASRGSASELGTAAVETVLVVPVLIVLLLFIVFVGRVGSVPQDVYSAARDASRAASLRGSPTAAVVAAETAASDTLAARSVSCRDLAVKVDTSRFGPGGSVAVEVACTVSLSDVSRLGVPGSKRVSARFVSVIDRYRGAP